MPDLSASPPSPIRIWITAVRPFSYTASLLAVCCGATLAQHLHGVFYWDRFLLTLFGVAALHTAGNLLNDSADFQRGLDTEIQPTSGAVARGWITAQQARRAALGCAIAGTLTAFILARRLGWWLLIPATLGLLLAFAYTRDRGNCLKYRGMGDIAVFLAFGILPILGAFWVQTPGDFWAPFWCSIPVGLLTVGILHANNWRDRESDILCNSQTLAIRLGPRGSARYYRLLMLLPYVLISGYILTSQFMESAPFPVTAFLVFLALPLSLRLIRVSPDNRQDLLALDARTAQVHLAFCTLLSLSFII